jgi:L-fuculose-phosphate aldolase
VTLPAQREVAAYARRLHESGWVANHDGNVSVRAADGRRFHATPTATSKRLVDAADIITVDIDGKVLSGRHKLFGEWHLHAACFKARPDVGAVIHAHPPHATAIGLARRSLGVPGLPEMIVSLGKNIPTLDYAPPKSASQDQALARALTDGDADAVLVAANGVVTVGVDLEQAYLRMELVEHYARMMVLAASLGGVTALPDTCVAKFLDARTKAGLGRAGRAPR